MQYRCTCLESRQYGRMLEQTAPIACAARFIYRKPALEEKRINGGVALDAGDGDVHRRVELSGAVSDRTRRGAWRTAAHHLGGVYLSGDVPRHGSDEPPLRAAGRATCHLSRLRAGRGPVSLVR